MGVIQFYNHQSTNFENNLRNSIELNKPNLLSEYSVSTLKEHDVNLLEKEGLYSSFIELTYEWEILRDSVKNIQSINIEKINEANQKKIPFVARYTCYTVTFNNNPIAKMILCTEQFFNTLKINHIYYDYRLIL